MKILLKNNFGEIIFNNIVLENFSQTTSSYRKFVAYFLVPGLVKETEDIVLDFFNLNHYFFYYVNVYMDNVLGLLSDLRKNICTTISNKTKRSPISR